MNSNLSIQSPPASKRAELINFSGPKRSFGQPAIASGVGLSEAPKSERVPSQPASRKPAAVCDIFDNPEKKFRIM